MEKLVNMVAHENFGLLNDMGNFLCADEDPAEAIGRVAPYAFYVHAKDFLLKSGMEPDPGEGFSAPAAATACAEPLSATAVCRYASACPSSNKTVTTAMCPLSLRAWKTRSRRCPSGWRT